jgi:Ni/Co efflux regulator RcnB
MNHILTFSIAIILAAGAFTPAEAKKKDKDKDRDDKDRVVYVERDRDRDWDRDRDRSRTIYVIERNRPVERVVYLDRDGRYYRWIDGQRIYVTGRYYDSFPDRYYYRDGRPRITVTLPF